MAAIEAPENQLAGLAAEVKRQVETKDDYVADTRTIGYFVEGGPDEKPLDEAFEAGAPDEVLSEGIAREQDEGNKGRTTVTIDGIYEGQEIIGQVGAPALTEFEVNDHAHGQIAARLKIPAKFYDRLRFEHPDLLQHNVTALFNREPERRLLRTIDGKMRAFLSDRYRMLDNYDLLERSVLPALAETKMQIKSCALTETRLYIKAVFPDVVADVKEGDTVFGGILIQNSEVGAGAMTVEPLVWRLICKNGMIAPVHFADFGLRKYHVGKRIDDVEAARSLFSDQTLALDDEAFFAMVFDIVKGAAGAVAFQGIVERMRELAGIKPGGDPVKAVERLGKREHVSEGERTSILTHLIEGGDLSAWGYLNAVTRSAQDIESYDRATDLERLGGQMLDWSERAWTELAAA